MLFTRYFFSSLFLMLFSYSLRAQTDRSERLFRKEIMDYLKEGRKKHHSLCKKWYTPSGKFFPFSEFSFSRYKEAEGAMKTMLNDGYQCRPATESDSLQVSDRFLAEHTDRLLALKNRFPWTRQYKSDVFKHWVAPYRVCQEPFFEYSDEFDQFHQNIKIEAYDSLYAIAEQINQNVSDYIFYRNYTWPDRPTLTGAKQVVFRKAVKDCINKTTLCVYFMRAAGFACAMDYVPFWGASSNRHSWAVIMLPDGKKVPFNIEEQFPHDLARRVAKVFRYTFHQCNSSYAVRYGKEQLLDGHFKSVHLLDVTDDYSHTFSLTLNASDLETQAPLLYLSVFNLNKWKPIAVTRKDKGQYVFEKMGSDIVYLPVDQNKTPVGNPILLSPEGKSIPLSGEGGQIINHPIIDLQALRPRDNNSLELKPLRPYKLFRWDKQWKPIGTFTSTADAELMVQGLNTRTLYRLLPEKPDRFERMFVLEKSGVIQWF